MIFSERALEKGLACLIDFLSRNFEIRPIIWIAVTEKDPEELLKTKVSQDVPSGEGINAMIESQKGLSKCVHSMLTQALICLGNEGRDFACALFGTTKMEDEEFMEIKDRSSRSFPGDHASVLLLWTVFLSLFARGKRLLLVWLTGTLLILPRLVAGAHWLSDNLAGGGFVVMQTLAWGYYTAAGKPVYRLLSFLAVPCIRLARMLPLINQLDIVRLEQH